MPATLSAFDQAVAVYLLSPDHENLDEYRTAIEAVEDHTTFESMFLGIISCTIPAEVWREALKRARTSYDEYRPR